jgi:hypothetical protein
MSRKADRPGTMLPALALALVVVPALTGCPGLAPTATVADHLPDVRTAWLCPRCLEEAGQFHVCGKGAGHAERCETCGQERGAGHVCGVTHWCPECRTEVGLYHVHGVTRWCGTCRQEAGPDHICGKTRYCPVCRREVEGRHSHSRHEWASSEAADALRGR